jgi:hypothetical protein
LAPSQESDEVVLRQFRVAQDLAQQPPSNDVSGVDRDSHDATIGVPQPNMASALPCLGKASLFERAAQFARLDCAKSVAARRSLLPSS